MKQAKKSSKFNKKILILIISLCVLLVGIVVTIIFITTKTSTPETDPRSFEEIYWDSETAEEAIETFQQKIDATTDPEQKAELLRERSNFLFENFAALNMFQEQIISDLIYADELDNTPSSAFLLIDRYSYYGNSEKTNKYEQEYEERIGK